MRPALLDPLFTPVTSLAKIGSKFAQHLKKQLPLAINYDIPLLIDLLYLKPTRFLHYQNISNLAQLKEGMLVTTKLQIAQHEPALNNHSARPYRIIAYHGQEALTLVFFKQNPELLQKLLPPGQERVISGRVSLYNNNWVIVHPQIDSHAKEAVEQFFSLYNGAEHLRQKTLKFAIEQALDKIPPLPEWLNSNFLAQENLPSLAACCQADLPSFAASLRELHFPTRHYPSLLKEVFYLRLVYDELLAEQLTLALRRSRYKGLSARPFSVKLDYKERLLREIPFQLTNDQKKALQDIEQDLAADSPMLRLLQGDVGSGKTVIALFAILQIISHKAQASLMAPTELLARQHFNFIEPLLRKMGFKTALLTSAISKKARDRIEWLLAQGELDLLIGTHALLESNIKFKNLQLAIIDEQHRFGVAQRFALIDKGRGTHLLVMTATPIPRSLELTSFGDMSISRIKEKPPGRRAIKTAACSQSRLPHLLERLKIAMAQKQQIYWICPLIEDSEKLNMTSALKRFAMLQKIFGPEVGLIHGKMLFEEKEQIMRDFAQAKIKLLIATTVIEVGIDVSQASIIIIEHAERFGLAQLHQLRGRVGRGSLPSSCVLLYSPPLSDIARERLRIIRDNHDGFHIAKADLRLRGPGDLLGTKQAGLREWIFANLEEHENLLEQAQRESRAIIARDPQLASERGQALRLLLFLFRKNEALKLLQAG